MDYIESEVLAQQVRVLEALLSETRIKLMRAAVREALAANPTPTHVSHKRRRLNHAKAIEIHRRFGSGESIKTLAQEYDVSEQAVNEVLSGRNYPTAGEYVRQDQATLHWTGKEADDATSDA